MINYQDIKIASNKDSIVDIPLLPFQEEVKDAILTKEKEVRNGKIGIMMNWSGEKSMHNVSWYILLKDAFQSTGQYVFCYPSESVFKTIISNRKTILPAALESLQPDFFRDHCRYTLENGSKILVSWGGKACSDDVCNKVSGVVLYNFLKYHNRSDDLSLEKYIANDLLKRLSANGWVIFNGCFDNNDSFLDDYIQYELELNKLTVYYSYSDYFKSEEIPKFWRK